MKTTYFLGLDVAKHKIRLALSDAKEQLLLEKDLPVNTAGLRELLAKLKLLVPEPEQQLVGRAFKSRLRRGGDYPLIAHRLYRVENSLRDNKTYPIDARRLCAIAALHGEKLQAHYRFSLQPEQWVLQPRRG